MHTVCQINDSSNPIACFILNQNFDPREAYKRGTLFNPFILSYSVISTKCISCKQPVRARQEGLQCDGCLRWQHRKCSTGVYQSDYHDTVKNVTSIDWRCSTCDFVEPFPLAESTPVNFESTVCDSPSAQSVHIASDLPAADPVEDPARDESSIFELPSMPDTVPMEISLEDSAVGPDLPPEAPVEKTYHLVLEGTIQGKTRLVTNIGYAFKNTWRQLDLKYNVASLLLVRLHAVYKNQQRHRGMAPQSQSKSHQPSSPSLLPASGAATPGS